MWKHVRGTGAVRRTPIPPKQPNSASGKLKSLSSVVQRANLPRGRIQAFAALPARRPSLNRPGPAHERIMRYERLVDMVYGVSGFEGWKAGCPIYEHKPSTQPGNPDTSPPTSEKEYPAPTTPDLALPSPHSAFFILQSAIPHPSLWCIRTGVSRSVRSEVRCQTSDIRHRTSDLETKKLHKTISFHAHSEHEIVST